MVFSVPDMHTHSENSHDSKCKIKDMLFSQIEKGTNIFAVTDHFDTSFYNIYDIFAPIKNAHETIAELNHKYGNQCHILAGIEIGESFWFPEIYEKIKNYLDYDVIIGSVHLMRNKYYTGPFTDFDFSKVDQEIINEIVDQYLDDVLTMIGFLDFDILAHISYPLRYIVAKYNRQIDLQSFYRKLDLIFDEIIERNIALEVNTSSFDYLNDFMPSCDMIKKYYEKGGRLITLGSDAHIPERASIYFDKAVNILKEIGFDGVYYYKKRKAFKIMI